MFFIFWRVPADTCTVKTWLCFAGITRVWLFTVTLWEPDLAVRQIPDDILVCADFLHLHQTLGKRHFGKNVFAWKLKSNKHVLGPLTVLVWWIRVNNNGNYVTSERDEQWMSLFQSGGIRKHFTEDRAWPRFQFSYPPKTMIIFFEFHPIKTALRPQGTAAILRVRFPFQDLWWPVWRSSHQMQHGAITLAPQKKEIIIILLICLRYDERRKAELWLRCYRSCFFPGTDSHNELSAGL